MGRNGTEENFNGAVKKLINYEVMNFNGGVN